jgi:outer membrane protein assembly factor BamA
MKDNLRPKHFFIVSFLFVLFIQNLLPTRLTARPVSGLSARSAEAEARQADRSERTKQEEFPKVSKDAYGDSLRMISVSEEHDLLTLKDDETIKIDSVKIIGNDITLDFIILREITFRSGDITSGKVLRYNRERVFSLRLFSNVDFYINQENAKNILVIDVKESWYIYPLPFLRAQNRDFKKSTYGINLLYRNFRGRNETIRAMMGFGYDPFYSLSYENPALSYKNELGIQITFLYSRPTNKSSSAKSIIGDDFRYKIFSQTFGASKRFDQFNTGFVWLGFDYIETPIALGGISASGGKIDRTLYAGLGYFYDSRDLKQFSENGLYTFARFLHKGFGINNISYNEFEIDFREYRRIYGQLLGRWRFNYRAAFGEVVPFYNYSYLGYEERRVRGHVNDIREGLSYILTSFELGYPIVKEWDLSIKLPLLPEKLTSARIGIYLTSFFDTGNAFKFKEPISLNGFYSGYGFGITVLILPYNAMRFEYALNELGKGEFLIGMGFSF